MQGEACPGDTTHEEQVRQTLCAWRRFRRCCMTGAMKTLVDVPLTVLEVRVLFLLARLGQQDTGSMARTLGTRAPMMSLTVDHLFVLEMVDRNQDTEDRRRKAISLTDAGHHLIERLLVPAPDQLAALAGELDECELDALAQGQARTDAVRFESG